MQAARRLDTETVALEVAALTDRGHERSANEDHHAIVELPHGTALVVADGMGGLERGAVASALAVEAIVDHLSQAVLEAPEWGARAAIESAFAQAHRAIVAAAAAGAGTMGTTATLAYLSWPTLWVAHVGDSRCYVVRDGNLVQLTEDHTVAQQFLRLGMRQHAVGKEHVLYKALGACCNEAGPDIRQVDLQVGDAVVVCSDGLTRHVSDGALAATLRVDEAPRQTCRRLVRSALAGGGSDNITVGIARVRDAAAARRGRNTQSGVRPRPYGGSSAPPDESERPRDSFTDLYFDEGGGD
jgi:protein phosphatase